MEVKEKDGSLIVKMDKIQFIGNYDYKFIENFSKLKEIEFLDIIEGNLIDNMLFYNSKAKIYYMCLELATTTWTSVYKLYSGNEKEIYEIWNELERNDKE